MQCLRTAWRALPRAVSTSPRVGIGGGGARRTVVTVEHHDGDVARLCFDDGKMNIFTFEALESWRLALDDCESAGALVLTGNDQAFSAGFDLSVMGAGKSPEAAEMLRQGGELVLRIAEWKRPTLICATGHSLALGAIMTFAADYRLGVSDKPKAKTGMTEVAIGLPVPQFAMELARQRLATTHLTRATVLSEVFSSERAVDAGFLDTLVPSSVLSETALAMAAGVSSYKDAPYQATKGSLWGSTLTEARALLDVDVAGFR